MTSGPILTAEQIAQLRNDTDNGTENFLSGYADISSDISLAIQAGASLDAATSYWYSQAPTVNNAASDSPAKYFIRDVTEYGERLDGKTTGNTQAISDRIAQNVIQTTITSGYILTLPQLLGRDIGGAITDSGLTIGGWGGSFYYWNERPVLADGTAQPSIGAQITAALPAGKDFDGGGQYDKFIAVNAAALADQLHSLGGTYAAILNTAEAVFGVGAEVPNSIGLQIAQRAADIVAGAPIVGNADQIDDYAYFGSGWYSVNLTFADFGIVAQPVQVMDTTLISELNTERAWRSNYQSLYGQSNTDLQSSSAAPLRQVGHNVSSPAIFNEDGSAVQYGIEPYNSGYIVTNISYAADGHKESEISLQLGAGYVPQTESVDLFDSQSHPLASEQFGTAAGTGQLVLEGADFDSQTADWSSVRMSFIAGTQNVSSVSFELSNGSSEEYQPGTNGNWSESFTDATGTLTQDWQHGTFYDTAKGMNVVGVQVTDFQNNTTTVYADSDGDAPTYQIPGGAPSDYPSAASFWANALSTSSGAGTSVTTGSAVAPSGTLAPVRQDVTVAPVEPRNFHAGTVGMAHDMRDRMFLSIPHAVQSANAHPA